MSKDSQEKIEKYYLKHALSLLKAGYEPLPIIPRTKRPTVDSWTTIPIDDDQVSQWVSQYPTYGVGLRTGSGFCPLDVDIYDEGVARKVAAYIDTTFGNNRPVIRRFGELPKFLVPAYCDDISSKMVSDAYVGENGVESRIEILASGQQVVVHGIHENTGNEYQWAHGSLTEELLKITKEDILSIFDEFYRHAREAGMVPAKAQQEYIKTRTVKHGGVGDQYNEDTDITDLITDYSWVLTAKRGSLPDGTPVRHVRRPGKSKGVSGTIINGTHLHVFTTSVSVLPEGTYDAFGIYTRYEHGGDFTAAVKKLVAKGHGHSPASTEFANASDVYHTQHQEECWLQPISLERPEISELDIADLPPVLGDMVDGVSKATETPVELASLLGIATLATACQKKFVVEPEPGYREPLNIWTLTFLEPGNRKSSVQQYLSRSLIEYEKERFLEMEPWIQEAASKKRNQEARIATLRSQYTKAKPTDLDRIEKEILKEENNPVEVPKREQFWTQDVTPERLGTIMDDNNESTSILSAEGGIFENIGGRYSGSVPNLDVFLQAHSGDSVRVDRGSREAVYMENPALTMGLSAQPGILHTLERHKSFRSLGLWARFLYAIPPSPLGHRTLNTTPLPSPVRDSFNSCVKTLLSIQAQKDEHGNKVPFILHLSPESYSLWKSFSLGVERELADGGEFEHIRDWAGKLPGQALRLAGIFHCTEKANSQPWSIPIDEMVMQKALNIAAALSQHALTVFDLMGASQELKAANKIWRWIERNRFFVFKKRDCHQALRGSFPKVADMAPGLSMLTERYYIRRVPQEKGGGGRPPEIYEVNPTITEEWK